MVAAWEAVDLILLIPSSTALPQSLAISPEELKIKDICCNGSYACEYDDKFNYRFHFVIKLIFMQIYQKN